ncbi:N-6 DNA methylase [Streptomyces smyrnaeus]|uniref:N-6 DNA methylase n=1 Tax=Streptomyces smyrnaeus TaxID=1387713 RepID=UPI0036C9AA4A
MHTPGNDPLLRRSQIAALAGVSRPTITAWEKSASDFPAPWRAGDQEHFRRSDVLKWLDQRQIPRRKLAEGEKFGITYGDRFRRAGEVTGPSLPPAPLTEAPKPAAASPGPGDHELVQQLMSGLVDRVRGAASVIDYLNFLIALLYLRGRGRRRWGEFRDRARVLRGANATSQFLRDVGRVVDEEIKQFAVVPGLESALRNLEPRTARDVAKVVNYIDQLHEDAFVLILDEYEERAALGSREFFTPRAVTRLMSGLVCPQSKPRRPRTFYDPFARGGETLLEAAVAHLTERDDDRPHEVRVVGETRRADTWRLANVNLLLHGVRPDLELRNNAPWVVDSVRRTEAFADIVLTNPPFNMSDSAGEPRREGDWPYGAPPVDNDNFAYLQHCLAALREGGRAGVIMPNKAGNSGHPAERGVRKRLVEAGVVECVIALPPKLFTRTPVPVSVWLLRHAADPCEEVLFIDASELGTTSGSSNSRRVLSQGDIEAVIATYRAYGREAVTQTQTVTDSVPHALVTKRELAEKEYTLNPLEHVRAARPGRTTPEASLRASWCQLQEAQSRLGHVCEEAAHLPRIDWQKGPANSGRVPVDLPPLRDLCEIQAGPSYSKLGTAQRTAEGEVPVVFPRHLVDGRIQGLGDERISGDLARRLAGFFLHPDDIVCIRTGAIGPPALVTSRQANCLMSPNVIRLRLKESAPLLPQYLLYYLCRDETVTWMRDRAASTATPSLRSESLGHLQIPLPTLMEQRAIADTLVGLHDLDQAHREYAAALRQLRVTMADALIGTALDSDIPSSMGGSSADLTTTEQNRAQKEIPL